MSKQFIEPYERFYEKLSKLYNEKYENENEKFYIFFERVCQ